MEGSLDNYFGQGGYTNVRHRVDGVMGEKTNGLIWEIENGFIFLHKGEAKVNITRSLR